MGMIAPQAPQRRDLGEWLFGLPAKFDRYYETYPDRGSKVNRVFESLVDFDAARRDWKNATRAAAENGHLVRRAQRARRDADRRRYIAHRRLAAFVQAGLERCEGQRLQGEANTWMHLAARGFSHPDLRVCEQCAVVFRAGRARRCFDCRRSPVRIKLHPLEAGGWHVDYRVGGRRAASDTFDRTVHYTTVCRGCDVRFETTRADRRLCLNCGGGSGRVRRHRGGSRTGRQRYRFRHAEGSRDWSVSFNTLDGRSVHLEALDGVIETDDAEVAQILDNMAVPLDA